MATSIRIRVAGVEGATLDEAAEALGGTVEHLNGGDYLALLLDLDPESRRRSRGGKPRKPLPEGSPLAGMGEAEAMSWALSHGVDELSQALGVSRATAYRRLRSGRVL
jgi:transcriptional regulator of acetoin/glycerol metabolism